MNSQIPSAIAEPQDSSTVLLLRAGAAGLETLMLQRHASMNFAAGDWVFPGGACEIADRSARVLQRVRAPQAETLAALRRGYSGEELTPDHALGLCVAACRETFEESGVLLARHSHGGTPAAALVSQLQRERQALLEQPDSFAAMLERHDLVLALDELVYWANWVTPSLSPRRFDARFFIAAMPEGQQVDPHLGESHDARWVALDNPDAPPTLTPPVTAPPTEFCLLELARAWRRLGSVPALLNHGRALGVSPVMVKMWRQAESMSALLPWDGDYASAPGEGVRCDDAMRQRYGAFTSRRTVDPRFKMPRPKPA